MFNTSMQEENLKGLELKKEIDKLLEKGISKTMIAKQLGVSRQTIYNHCSKDISVYLNDRRPRTKPLKVYNAYEPIILEQLQKCPTLNNAQIKDRLLAHYQELYDNENYELNVGDSALRDYINRVRTKYSIPKRTTIPQTRDYVMRPHDTPGLWMQVDFGEYRMQTYGGNVKVHFIVFSLTYSKMLYIRFLNRPFKAKDAVESHLMAFSYFGGITEKINYDQDKKLLYREDKGNFIYVKEFEELVNEYEFMAVLQSRLRTFLPSKRSREQGLRRKKRFIC